MVFSWVVVSFAFHPDDKPGLQQLLSAVGREGPGEEGAAPGLLPSPSPALCTHLSACLFLRLALPAVISSAFCPASLFIFLCFFSLLPFMSSWAIESHCASAWIWWSSGFIRHRGRFREPPLLSPLPQTAAGSQELFDNRRKAQIQADLDSHLDSTPCWPIIGLL